MKKISIIGTVGIPAKYGGFETLAENIVNNLNENYKITVFCSSKKYKKKLENYNQARLKYINLNANGIQSIPYDIISILNSIKFADTLLILGVSGCLILPFIKLFTKKRIIVNIDGLEWKREKWSNSAKLFLKFSEKLAVKFADCIVSDNAAIQKYLFEEYKIRSNLITYGADHVKKESLTEELKDKYPVLKNKYALKVCRIEPENNVDLILEAFSEYKSLNIVIIGNWQNSSYGKNLKERFIKFKNIHLFEPIYEQNILNQIRGNCYLYIHGHSAGGTNPSLVEAMYLKLPIFAYKISYNEITTFNKAKYFSSKNDLLDLLQNTNKPILANIAINMKTLANKEYNWKKISNEYSKLF